MHVIFQTYPIPNSFSPQAGCLYRTMARHANQLRACFMVKFHHWLILIHFIG
jgi:hypothetical protein